MPIAPALIPCVIAALVGVRTTTAPSPEVITFSFEGQIDSVEDPLGVLGGTIPVGTPF